MKAQDVMTRDVVTVGPYTAVPDIAAIMAEKQRPSSGDGQW